MARPGRQQWTWLSVTALPAVLDIVWCRFPEQVRSKGGPKDRPGLVRAIKLSANHQRARIEVTYGTSNIKFDSRPYDLVIGNAAELAAMGLPQQTRFDLDQSVWLPWCAEFFVARSGYSSPIIGHLTPTAVAQLEALKVMRRTRR